VPAEFDVLGLEAITAPEPPLRTAISAAVRRCGRHDQCSQPDGRSRPAAAAGFAGQSCGRLPLAAGRSGRTGQL